MQTVIRHRRLPHWDVPGATYFITTCLEGSIPAMGLLDIERYFLELESRPPLDGIDYSDWRDRHWKLIFGRTDHWLDTGSAVRHFENPVLSGIALEAIRHFAEVRYDSLAYVVMPSHLHWVFRPLESRVESLGAAVEERSPRARIMHSLKTHIALECNRLLGLQGRFWQQESYDRCVRGDGELERIIGYVEQNPVVAGLVAEDHEFEFSSAHHRSNRGIDIGEPLCS